MSAASAFPPDPTEGRPAEPSMEDILASIRRIIADDQSQGGKPSASANGASRRPASPAQDSERAMARSRTPYDDVLDLARMVPSDRAVAASSPVEHHEAQVSQPSASMALEPAPVAEAHRAEDYADAPADEHHPAVSGLRARLPEPLARGTAQGEDHDMLDYSVPAVSQDGEGDLLSAPLGESVMSAFETLAATVVLQNTPMLERVMRDLLRPMLKTWLDDNLPGLVERLVRAEIERVARGTRG